MKRGELASGFYKQQRDRVLEENESLRRRVKHLETKLSTARDLLAKAAAAVLYD